MENDPAHVVAARDTNDQLTAHPLHAAESIYIDKLMYLTQLRVSALISHRLHQFVNVNVNGVPVEVTRTPTRRPPNIRPVRICEISRFGAIPSEVEAAMIRFRQHNGKMTWTMGALDDADASFAKLLRFDQDVLVPQKFGTLCRFIR